MTSSQFGELPAVRIVGPDGSRADVTLFGAHLLSWRTADGRERLFCSARSQLDGSRAIRGGVPVIFPQFGARGSGLRHGFARVATWRLADNGQDDGDCYAEFHLSEADLAAELAAAWPFAFELRLRVTLQTEGVDVSLSVRNTGTEAFPFSAALHTYYLIDQLEQAELAGLQHVRFGEDGDVMALQDEELLHFDDKLDRMYFQLPGPLTLRAGADTLQLEQEGFTDAVVWNPGAADAAALADLDDAEYRRFICVEPALIEPDTLAAGFEWTGLHRIRIVQGPRD
ncbi:glucose-6-phosphate 1-epimerase [Oxalobacteraceae bacterium GrIS 1.11]